MAPLRLAILKHLIGLHPEAFLRCVMPSVRATAGLALAVNIVRAILLEVSVPATLLIAGSTGMATYIGMLLVFHRDLLRHLIDLAKRAR